MTDPLGQAQVIPYLIGLSQAGYRITLLSCEKKDKFQQQNAYIQALLTEHKIQWKYIFFTASPPILAKYYDLYQLRKKAVKLQQQNNFSLVHTRSYVAADIGYFLKKKYHIKFLFDIRGFWVDERVDGGLWNLKNPIYRRAYHIYKEKEANYVSTADTIVSLTENGKLEMQTWKSYHGTEIKVIPCCADYDLFSLVNPIERDKVRLDLGFAKDDFVISYLGSIGTWYMLDEMLEFFKEFSASQKNAKFLFISNGEQETIKAAARKKGISELDIKIVSAKRKEVPIFAKASNISLSFIKPCYSKKSSSPTKLGELLAMGIPTICNTGIGDVDEIINYTNGGLMINGFSKNDFEGLLQKLDTYLHNQDAASIRERSKKYYDLKDGIEKYKQIYSQLLDN